METISKITDFYPTGPYLLFDNGEFDQEVYTKYFKEREILTQKAQDSSIPKSHREQAVKELQAAQKEIELFNFEVQRVKFREGLLLIKASPEVSSKAIPAVSSEDYDIYGYIDEATAMGRYKEMVVEGKNLIYINASHVFAFEARPKTKE